VAELNINGQAPGTGSGSGSGSGSESAGGDTGGPLSTSTRFKLEKEARLDMREGTFALGLKKRTLSRLREAEKTLFTQDDKEEMKLGIFRLGLMKRTFLFNRKQEATLFNSEQKEDLRRSAKEWRLRKTQQDNERKRNEKLDDDSFKERFNGYDRAWRENDRRTEQERRALFTDYAKGWRDNLKRDQPTEGGSTGSRIVSGLSNHVRSNGGFFSRGAASVADAATDAGLVGEGAIGGGVLGAGLIAAYGLDTVLAAPQKYARLLAGLNAEAAPHYQFVRSTQAAGLAGGFSPDDLRNAMYAQGSPDFPAADMMRRYGWDQNAAMGVLQDTGIPITSSSQGLSLLSSIGSASQSQFLGDLSPTTLANMLGQVQTLAPGDLESRMNGGSGGQGSAYSGDAFFNKLKSVMQVATAYGLDHAKVGQTLMDALSASASAGGSNVDAGGLADLWNRAVTSGNASMRSGEGFTNAIQGLSNTAASAGFAGPSPINAAILAYTYKHNGGKLPTTRAQMEKLLNVKYELLSPQGQLQFNQALQAAKSGDQQGWLQATGQLIQPDQMRQIAEERAQSYGLGGAETSTIAGFLETGNPATAYSTSTAFESGSGAGLPAIKLKTWDDVPGGRSGNYANWIHKYAKANNLDPSVVASLISREDPSWNPAAYNGTGGGFGAVGLGSIRKTALTDLQQHGMEQKTTPHDLLDPETNIRVTSEYLGLLTQRTGNTKTALENYRGADASTNNAYATGIIQAASGIGNPSTAPGPVANMNTNISNGGNATQAAADLANIEAMAAASRIASQTLGSWTQELNNSESVIAKYIQSMTTLINTNIPPMGPAGGERGGGRTPKQIRMAH
jgi:soluble lytic murein transglycosylase-like protein